jgi:hypothetical protein
VFFGLEAIQKVHTTSTSFSAVFTPAASTEGKSRVVCHLWAKRRKHGELDNIQLLLVGLLIENYHYNLFAMDISPIFMNLQ